MLAAEGPSRIVRELSWLNLKNTELAGMDVVELGARAMVARRLCVLRHAVSAVAPLLARAALRPHLLRRRAHEPAMAGVHERGGGDGTARGGGSEARTREQTARDPTQSAEAQRNPFQEALSAPLRLGQARSTISLMANVGVIGLGAMGAPMARNLLKGGHSVTVFARRAEAMAPLIAAGAAGASSPADSRRAAM